MRTAVLEYLACPSCNGHLIADAEMPCADGHIMTGTLVCGCGNRYPIVGGIPRLTPQAANLAVDETAEKTASRFGAEWAIFNHKADYFEQQFLDWIAPTRPSDFIDKVVLEGGCGKGRHSALVSRWGARAVVSVDLGDAVEVAFASTRHLANVHVVQGDVTRPPVGKVFDLAFSVGVLHHLPAPAAGFRALTGRLRKGGRIVVWVYGYESNEWIVRFVDPLRKHVTSKIPETVLYWSSLPPAAALTAALRLYRLPAVARRLPYGAYLGYISGFPFREVHHIMFDQLVTPVAHYLRKGEVAAWFRSPSLAQVQISWHNKNSWRATAIVDDEAGAVRGTG